MTKKEETAGSRTSHRKLAWNKQADGVSHEIVMITPRNRQKKAFLCLACSIIAPMAWGESWETYRIADAGTAIPEDLENFTLVGISADAAVVAGNEVGDWNAFPNEGPDEFRYMYPFYWKDGMDQVQEITPNTDEIIPFPNGYRGRVTGVSRDGKWIIGEYATAHPLGFHQAFLYDVENGVFEYLGDFGWSTLESLDRELEPGEYLASLPTGITADGSVVVGWARNPWGLPKAFKWTRATGMVQAFNAIPSWNDEREDRYLGISPDGRRIVGDEKFLQTQNDAEKQVRYFLVDHGIGGTIDLHVPLEYSLQEISEVSGPDNSILGSIRSPEQVVVESGGHLLDYEQVAVRWHPDADSYQLFPVFYDEYPTIIRHWHQLTCLSQTDDGNFMTFSHLGIAPTDGSAEYGIFWTREEGMVNATRVLADEYEIDFGEGAVSKVLPSRDGTTIVAEVYTSSSHHRKALARFDLTEDNTPLQEIFPKSSYSNGWRTTHLGRFNTKHYPFLWWEGIGWAFISPNSNSDTGIWLWNEDLGWCVNYPPFQQVWSYEMNEWISVTRWTGWLYSKSRGWFQVI